MTPQAAMRVSTGTAVVYGYDEDRRICIAYGGVGFGMEPGEPEYYVTLQHPERGDIIVHPRDVRVLKHDSPVIKQYVFVNLTYGTLLASFDSMLEAQMFANGPRPVEVQLFERRELCLNRDPTSSTKEQGTSVSKPW